MREAKQLRYLEITCAQCLTFSNPASSSVLPVTMSKYPKMELYSKPPTPARISGLMKTRMHGVKQADQNVPGTGSQYVAPMKSIRLMNVICRVMYPYLPKVSEDGSIRVEVPRRSSG